MPARSPSVMRCRRSSPPQRRRGRAAGGMAGSTRGCPRWPVTSLAGPRENCRDRPGASPAPGSKHAGARPPVPWPGERRQCRSHAGQSEPCGLRWWREADPRCSASSPRTAAGCMIPFPLRIFPQQLPSTSVPVRCAGCGRAPRVSTRPCCGPACGWPGVMTWSLPNDCCAAETGNRAASPHPFRRIAPPGLRRRTRSSTRPMRGRLTSPARWTN